MQILEPMTNHLTRAFVVWRWAGLAALLATTLVVLQDALYGGLPAQTPFGIALAQYTLPWLTWAALAPALLLMFTHFPIDLRRPWRPLTGYFVVSILVVGLKLILTVPVTALLIWKPLSVDVIDGVRWLLAHRATSNLLIFWMLLASYTCYRYYQLSAFEAPHQHPADPLTRIPVRAGERTLFVSVSETMFVEAERNHLILHTTTGQYSIRSTLQDLEKRLPVSRFLRIHRSRLVNIDRIEAIEPWGRGDYVLIMKDGTRLISGKTYRDAIRRILHIRES